MSVVRARRARHSGQARFVPSGFREAGWLSLITTKRRRTAPGVRTRSSHLSNQSAPHGWQMSMGTTGPYFRSKSWRDMSWRQPGQFIRVAIDTTEPTVLELGEGGATLRAEFARASERRLAPRADHGRRGNGGGSGTLGGAVDLA